MILCGDHCDPICDFCIHALHEFYKDDNGLIIKCGPIGCCLNRDYEHQELARDCGYCDDFHCFRVKEPTNINVKGEQNDY